MGLFATLSTNDTEHNLHSGQCILCRYAECRYTECRYAECHGAYDASYSGKIFLQALQEEHL